MANKKFLLGMLVLVLVFGMTVIGCYTPPRYSPLTSMTVVMVQRYPAKTAAAANVPMEVYIDGNLKTTVEDNRFAVIPVNDGVHSIFVKVGEVESERLNFTAKQNTVPFLASIDSKGILFWKKYIVKLERSTIVDDTGVMTDKESVQEFTP